MNAAITAIVSRKGGVGKTTTTISLAAYLADQGHKTLLVDADPQGNAGEGLGLVLEEIEGQTLYEAMKVPERAGTYIIEMTQNLHLLPATKTLFRAETEYANDPDRNVKLEDVLENLCRQYDHIIVDTPPNLGFLTLNALIAARFVIVPIQAEQFAYDSLSETLATIQGVKRKANKGLTLTGVLLTMVNNRLIMTDVIADQARRAGYETLFFQTRIPRTIALAESATAGKPIFAYDGKSAGAHAYADFGKEFVSRAK